MSDALAEQYKALKSNIADRYGKIEAPESKRRFPSNLSSLSEDDIVNWLAHYTEWQVYAGTQAGEADADRKVAMNIYKDRKNAKIASLSSAKSKKFELEAEVDNDPDIHKLKDRWQFLEGKFVLENSYREGFEKYCFVLSRELTRRLKGDESYHRKDRFGDGDRIDHMEMEPEPEEDAATGGGE